MFVAAAAGIDVADVLLLPLLLKMLPSVGAAGVTAAALPKGLLTLPNTEAAAPPIPPPPPPATGCVVARLNGVTTAVVVVMLLRPLPKIGAAPDADADVAAEVGAANRLLDATVAVPAVDVAVGQPKLANVGADVVAAGTAADVAGCTAAAGLAPKLNGVVLNVDVVVLLPPPRLAMLILGELALLPKLNIGGSDFEVLLMLLLLAAATAAPKKFGLLVLMVLLPLPSGAAVVFAAAAAWLPKKKLLLLLVVVLVVVNVLAAIEAVDATDV